MKNNKKILIIDDDKIFIKILRDSLGNGYDVEIALDGEEGLVKFKEFNPELVVLDLKMPKMDGIEFLKKLQADKKNKPTNILISSNSSDIEKISEGFALGIRGYVVKSDYSMENLVKRIQNLFIEELSS